MDIYHYLLLYYGTGVTICLYLSQGEKQYWYRKYHEKFNDEISNKLKTISKFIMIYDHNVRKGLKDQRYKEFRNQLISKLPKDTRALADIYMDDIE